MGCEWKEKRAAVVGGDSLLRKGARSAVPAERTAHVVGKLTDDGTAGGGCGGAMGEGGHVYTQTRK